MRLLCQRTQYLQFTILLNLLLSDTVDKITNIVNVIPEKHTSKKRNNNYEKRLHTIRRMQITKTNRQNYSRTEIVTPNVLLIPNNPINIVG